MIEDFFDNITVKQTYKPLRFEDSPTLSQNQLLGLRINKQSLPFFTDCFREANFYIRQNEILLLSRFLFCEKSKIPDKLWLKKNLKILITVRLGSKPGRLFYSYTPKIYSLIKGLMKIPFFFLFVLYNFSFCQILCLRTWILNNCATFFFIITGCMERSGRKTFCMITSGIFYTLYKLLARWNNSEPGFGISILDIVWNTRFYLRIEIFVAQCYSRILRALSSHK